MAKFFYTFLSLVVLIVVSVGDGRSTAPRSHARHEIGTRIVGGGFGTDGQFPFQVALFQYVLGQWSFYCGGTIISPKYVLTAAHCLRNRLASGVRARGGEFFLDDLTGHEQEILGKTNHIYPGYDPELLLNDIAILELSTDFELTGYVQPLALPSPGNEIGEGEYIRVTGWGPTVSGGLVSRRLHFLDLTYGRFETCDAAYPGLINVDSTFCAGETGKGSCGADGGSPVTYNKTVIGIVSRVGCGEEGLPDVHTKVAHYLDWIKATTNL